MYTAIYIYVSYTHTHVSIQMLSVCTLLSTELCIRSPSKQRCFAELRYLTGALWHVLIIAYYLVITANPEGFDTTHFDGLLIPIVAMCLLSCVLLPMVNYLGMSIQAQQEIMSRHDCNIVANPAKTIRWFGSLLFL